MRSARLSGPTLYGAGPFIYVVIHFTPVAIVRINNPFYHPFVSLTRDTEGTKHT
jgi:hypothetical protein